MDFQTIAPQLKTGDVILFHGTTDVSLIIDWITHSTFSHVGMVVRQGGQPGNDNLYIWQSFEPQHGVVYEPLEAFLETYVHSETGASFAIRQLSQPLGDPAVSALETFMPQVLGRPFPTTLPWIAEYVLGNLGIATSQSTFYCSELVAQSFMNMGLLPPRPLATTYTPRSFSAANTTLPLANGFSLGPEIPVTLSGSLTPGFVKAAVDPVPPGAYPSFAPVSGAAPKMPDAWTATVLLHPFSPPPQNDPKPDSPYYQMGLATLDYLKDVYFSARVAGCENNWWYVVTPDGTTVSLDEGKSWKIAEMGWSLPRDWYGAQAPNVRSTGASRLNWMFEKAVDWWVLPVPLPGDSPPAATWMWFDSATKAPVRMMFGNGPPSPTLGDPNQLAFFQMFSLIHFASFKALDAASATAVPSLWADPVIPGLSVGNPNGYKPFVWPDGMATTTFSTPVNGLFNPLPSRTLYVWKDDANYSTYTDRAQSTLMHYTYNQPAKGQKAVDVVESLLTGVPPQSAPADPYAGAGFLYTHYKDGSERCETGDAFPFGAEPPTWLSVPGHGICEATIIDNANLCPQQTVTIWSVVFPRADKYPQGTYLWTWYSPLTADGALARPVLFMQAQSGVNSGTSLALDDYYWFDTPTAPIDPANFIIPPYCLTPYAIISDPTDLTPPKSGKKPG
jgi:hypothetical protein